MRREDVNVELRGDELCISGKTSEEDRGNVLRRRARRFSYRTSVPGNAGTENIRAEMAHEVLTVRLPKSARAQARKIEIGGGSAGARNAADLTGGALSGVGRLGADSASADCSSRSTAMSPIESTPTGAAILDHPDPRTARSRSRSRRCQRHRLARL